MRIIQLQASNIKKLKAIELTFDKNKNLIILSGKNGQGKSSVLDAIWWALGGTKNIQDKPIRKGQESAEVIVDIEAKTKQGQKIQYIVTRTFTEKGSYLKVSNSDGSIYSNPQQFLDYIVGHLSFDPLEFSRLDNKRKVEELKNILKLDFSKLDNEKTKLTEERLFVGREMKTLKEPSDTDIREATEYRGVKEASGIDLIPKIQEAIKQRAKFNEAQATIKVYKQNIINLADIEDTKENIEELEKEVKNGEYLNGKISWAKKILSNVEIAKEKETTYKKLTEQIKNIEEEKAKQLGSVKLPIEDLSWDENTVLYKGIPFEQISSGEQLRVSMSIAMASNPKLKIIIIKDGSLLDKDNLSVIRETAKDKDFTVLVEKVDDSGKIGVYIEDGEIKAIN